MTQSMTHTADAASGLVPRVIAVRLRKLRHSRAAFAFVLTAPLMVIIGGLVVYPFFYSIFLSMLNKKETAFVGFDNFLFLFKRDTFWMVVGQSILFAVSAVFFKVIIGFALASTINIIPQKRQRFWRGVTLVPWGCRPR